MWFKTGSGELSDHPTIKNKEFKKPMILSTGMSTHEETNETYSIYLQEKFNLD